MTRHSDAIHPERAFEGPKLAGALPGPTLAPPIALATATFALGHAILGDALFHDGGLGIAFPIWIATIALGTVAVVWRARGRIGRETVAWLATAVMFACVSAWRESETLRFLNVVATLGALGLAAITIHDTRLSVFTSRLVDMARGLARSARGVMAGIVPLAVRDFAAMTLRQRWARSLRGAVRVAMIVLPLALIFGSLLSNADPIFASLVSLPAIDLDAVLSHVLMTGFFAWVLAGWMRSAILPADDTPHAALRLPFQLGVLETTAALMTLNVLFGVYIAAQLGWLFGGEAFLRARTGLTAAEYARHGFFETVAVVALVVPLLIGTRAAIQQDRQVIRRHTALALPVILLVSAIILSAIQRMRLYVGYYGMSTERLYTLVFMTWLGVILAWLAVTILRRRDRFFVGGGVASGLLTLGAMNVVSPDLFVARVNIERSAHATTPQQALDVAYLASLSGDAVSLTTRVLLEPSATAGPGEREQRCKAAQLLLARWGQGSRSRLRMEQTAAWRWWNSGERSAVRTVDQSSAVLRTIAHDGCARSPRETTQR
jgi:hypothetical protein